MHVVVIQGEYKDLLRQLFTLNGSGSIEFGSATSVEAANSLEILAGGVMFRDYRMEGFVRYSLRVAQLESGLQLEVGLMGTNRDEYVISSICSYIGWIGVNSA